jgi:hypothetical protein
MTRVVVGRELCFRSMVTLLAALAVVIGISGCGKDSPGGEADETPVRATPGTDVTASETPAEAPGGGPNLKSEYSPSGTIHGRILYQDLKTEEPGPPVSRAMIALCRISASAGTSEGPVIADSNREGVQSIGIIQAEPTTVTDPNGRFELGSVPPGTYLILFHLWPDRLDGDRTHWGDVLITEGHLDVRNNSITPSGKADFWEKGGRVVGLANWSQANGFRITQGTASSAMYGFCFGIRDEKPHPIVKVEAGSAVDVLLVTHIARE